MQLVLRPPALVALVLIALGGAIALAARPEARPPFAPRTAAAAFQDVARVLRHPRCMNCHPSGDRPHVGDDVRVHAMNVQRGPEGQGRVGQRCATCHRTENNDDARVPGAPHWHLAPRSMGWEGLDDHDLAEALKDPERNGGRSLADLRAHMAEDPLVLWGWEPGVGRAPVPVSHEAFVRSLDAWIEAGAPTPGPGTVSTF
ncbi:MAG: hypothetical protein AAFP22_03870 [Planctomycetota bacterium]